MDFPTYSYPANNSRIIKYPTNWKQLALNQGDYIKLADEFKVSIPLVKTVIEVESSGSGFLLNMSSPANPKILLEAHYVYNNTKTPVSKINPKLSQPTWALGKKHYLGDIPEWTIRLIPLMDILFKNGEDPLIATLCCSWGMGQVMGTNWKLAGCSSLKQFVEQNHAGEYWQARHMMNFIKNTALLPALKNQQWATFARGYNGSGYAKNKYDIKLAQAYSKYI